jgi:O-antigen/teichoic acid export membrane protein
MDLPARAALKPNALIVRLTGDSILRNNVVYLGGTVAAGSLGYVFHFLTGRLLGPAEYAIVASVLAALYIVSLPSLVVQIVSARFVSLAIGLGQSQSIPRLLLRLNIASLAVGALGALLLVAGAARVARYLQVSQPQLIYVLAVISVIALLVTANRGALQGMRRFWSLSGNTALDMVLRVVFAGVFITAGLGAVGGILALLVGPAIAYVQSIWLTRSREASDALSKHDVPSLLEVGRYALLATAGAAGVTYLFNADVILVKHYLSPDVAGQYAAGSVLARVVYFLGATVAAVMFPEVTKLHARDMGHFHVVDRSLLLLLVVAMGLVVIYAAVPSLVLLPYGKAFDPVRPYLGLFAFALSLLALSNLLVNYFLSVNSLRFLLPLAGACVLETTLVMAFHSSLVQVVTMVIISMATLTVGVGGLYLADRMHLARFLH